MARKSGIGDLNQIVLYELSAIGDFDTFLITLDKQVGVTYTGLPASENLNFAIDSRQRNKSLDDLFKLKVSNVVVETTVEKYTNNEQDTIVSGADTRTANGQDFGVIAYMASSIADDEDTVTREVLYGRGIFADGTGDSSSAPATLMPVAINIQIIDGEPMTIGSDLFDGLTVAADVTLTATEFGGNNFYPIT